MNAVISRFDNSFVKCFKVACSTTEEIHGTQLGKGKFSEAKKCTKAFDYVWVACSVPSILTGEIEFGGTGMWERTNGPMPGMFVNPHT